MQLAGVEPQASQLVCRVCAPGRNIHPHWGADRHSVTFSPLANSNIELGKIEGGNVRQFLFEVQEGVVAQVVVFPTVLRLLAPFLDA